MNETFQQPARWHDGNNTWNALKWIDKAASRMTQNCFTFKLKVLLSILEELNFLQTLIVLCGKSRNSLIAVKLCKISAVPSNKHTAATLSIPMWSNTFFFTSTWNLSLLFAVILTPSSRPANEPLTHAMSFTLRGLQSGSVYEAIVQAKNRYGWNEVSSFSSRTEQVGESRKHESVEIWNLNLYS